MQPWRDSNNERRLDGENGLLLTPTVGHLFDKGLVLRARSSREGPPMAVEFLFSRTRYK